MNDNIQKINKSDSFFKKKGRRLDIVAIIFCIVLAVAMWMYVMQTESPQHEEIITGIPVDLVNSELIQESHDLYVYSGYNYEVDITVVGKKSVINKLIPEDIKAYVDLSDINKPGQYVLDINVILPNGLVSGGTSFGSINVFVDEKDVITVDVIAKVESVSAPSEYIIDVPRVNYDTVTVTGPKNSLAEISHAEVGVQLGMINSSTTYIGQLSLVDNSGNVVNNPYIKLSRKEVTVTVPLSVTKTIDLSYSLKNGYLNNSNSEITISPSKITVKGDPLKLASLNELSIINIDETELSVPNTSMSVMIKLPEGMEIVEGSENAVVNVKLKNMTTQTYNVSLFQVEGAETKFDIVDEYVTVTLCGTEVNLGRITEMDMFVYLDLAGYTSASSAPVPVNGEIRFLGNFDGIFPIGECTVNVKFN